MKIALVCIAKNEENYIKEWIEYNKNLGFDKIFIYQNNWRCDLNDKIIRKIEFDGEIKQVPAYNHFIKKNKENFDWAAFFDVDEFLVLKKHNNVKNFIKEYKEFNGVSINWAIFGDNNLKKVENNNYSVLKRFTKRKKEVDSHVKSIVNLKKINKMKIHVPDPTIEKKYYCVDTNYKTVAGPHNLDGDDKIAQINHYFCKTIEEYKLKCDRGRADAKNIKRNEIEFKMYNKNEIEDLYALNFYNKNNLNHYFN